jgi:hypothetical protein
VRALLRGETWRRPVVRHGSPHVCRHAVPQIDLLTYLRGIEHPPRRPRPCPWGHKLTGCVIGFEARARRGPLRLFDVLDGEAYLPADVLALTAWVAEYYACGPGEVVAAAVPSMVWLGSRRFVAVTDDGIRAAAGELCAVPDL